MTTKKRFINFGLAFKLFVLVNIALAVAEMCPEGKFKSSFIDDCEGCPNDPETNCQNEGRDANNCETSCIKRDRHVNSSTGPNLAIPIGISVAVLLLIIILVLVVYAYRKRNKNTRAQENYSGDTEMETIVNETAVNMYLETLPPQSLPASPSVSLPVSPPPASSPTPASPPALPVASESDPFFGEGIAHDLNKETGGSLPTFN